MPPSRLPVQIQAVRRRRRGAPAKTPDRVRRVMGTLLAAFVVALSLPGAAAAQMSERIVFDFTGGSSISLLGGTITTPPDGTLDVGSARLLVEATAPGVYVPGGQFQLEGVNVAGTVAKNVAGVADISGTYAASQVGTLTGTLAAGQDGGDFIDSLSLFIDATIGCVGSGCGSLGLPIDELGISLLSVSFLPVTDLGIPGAARIETSIPIEIDGVLGTLDLVGVEVSRTLVPEPGTFVLVAAGLALLGARRSKRGR
jgi:hypothetical protein